MIHKSNLIKSIFSPAITIHSFQSIETNIFYINDDKYVNGFDGIAINLYRAEEQQIEKQVYSEV